MAGAAPEMRYAFTADGARVAYQLVGEGERDVVLLTDWVSCIELLWEQPLIARCLRRLAAHGRLILLDKRGNGASDPAPTIAGSFLASVEHSVEDLLAVLDAVGSQRADLIGSTYGGWTALLAAATHPDRVGRLVLQDACARQMAGDDYPHGVDEPTRDAIVTAILETYGSGGTLLGSDRTLWADEELRRWYGRFERLACDRISLAAGWRLIDEFDLRAALPLVQAEALVVSHAEGSLLTPAGAGAYLAERLPGATYVELSGPGTMFFGDERIAAEIDRFLGTAAADPALDDRVLASVLFTDLVDSTPTAARLGDRRWRELLDDHDRLCARHVETLRGRLVKTTGDGVLATFDGPARAVRCAQAICHDVRRLDVEVRAGVHAGEIELRGEDVGGIAVHVAARVMAEAGPGEVVVSRTVKDLTAGSGLAFEDRGVRELKGVPEPWQLFAVAF